MKEALSHFRIFRRWLVLSTLFMTILLAAVLVAAESRPTQLTKEVSTEEKSKVVKKNIPQLFSRLRERINQLKFNWDLSILNESGWHTGGYSVDGYPLIYWECGEKDKTNNSALILSSVHGDEVTPVYFGFRIVEWIKARPELCKDRHIVIAPFVNPDGFFRYSRGTRTNFNKVDLNRNFNTPDWAITAQKTWREKYKGLRRYYPGNQGGSEPETIFQQWLVDEYKPVKILSVHAPLNMMDYDGPVDQKTVSFMKSYIESCDQLREAVTKATPELKFFAYGLFPGSLGNYAGRQRGIPVLTAELPSTNANMAGHYFSMMEKGTKIFLDYELKDSPVRAAGPINSKTDSSN